MVSRELLYVIDIYVLAFLHLIVVQFCHILKGFAASIFKTTNVAALT